MIELLGRVSLFTDGEECLCKFIERYLKDCNPKYLSYKELLWKFMRCDAAHNILSQYGVVFVQEIKPEKFI